LPTLGLDLLQFGHDSCVIDDQIDSPFQYLFMGHRDTYSKMHRDTGGMAILIAPIIGKKELTLVHREDGRLLYHCSAPVSQPDCINYPLSAFIRAWKTTIARGDILVLPPGTYHAARNIEPCLSYSRLHVDSGDLMPFLNSWIANDAPSIHHREVIWNSCIELIKYVDKQAQSSANRLINADIGAEEMLIRRDAFSSLSMLRHVVQAVVNMNLSDDSKKSSSTSSRSSSSRVLQLMEVDVEEWKELLNDIDVSIRQYLIADLAQRPYLQSSLMKKDTTALNTITSNNLTTKVALHDEINAHLPLLCQLPHSEDKEAKADEEGMSYAQALMESLEKMESRSSKRALPTEPYEDEDDEEEDDDDDDGSYTYGRPARKKKASVSASKKAKHENLNRSGVLKDRKGNALKVGSIVHVGLFKEPGTIVELWTSKNCVSIHYDGFDKMYDEYVGLDDIHDIHGAQISIPKLYENMKVMAAWGEFRDEYLAQILPLHSW
jgi:hypothetical protein